MWATFNIVVFLVGLALAGYGKKIDRSENSKALVIFVIGIAVAVIGAISAGIELTIK